MSLLFGNADGRMCSCKWFGGWISYGVTVYVNGALWKTIYICRSALFCAGGSEGSKIWDDGELNHSWHAFPSGVLGKFFQGPSSPTKLVLWLCVLLRGAVEG